MSDILKFINEREVERALKFATIKHLGQPRKFTGEPYIEHPKRVAAIVRELDGVVTDYVVAALLHDTIEDTDTTYEEILSEFNTNVATLVYNLTRQKGLAKEKYYAKFSGCDRWTCVLKLADRLDNVRDLSRADEDFRNYYRRDTLKLLPHIQWADSQLTKEIERCL
jgi:(p)ppGpp synthase/HD superfamily hydrolase